MNPTVESVMLQETVIFVALVALAGWIVWLFFRRLESRTALERQRIELAGRLVEKFATASEFLEFARNEEGRRFLAPAAAATGRPDAQVSRLLQAGVITLVVGCAFLINAARITDPDPNFVNKAIDIKTWGTLFIASGMGLMVAAGISRWQARLLARTTDAAPR